MATKEKNVPSQVELNPDMEGTKLEKLPEDRAVGPVHQYDEDIGAGFEDTTKEDYTVPFLSIIQKSSPQVEEGKPEYNPDAKAGMIINTVTGELFPRDTGVRIVPAHRVHKFLEWRPRDSGGGLQGEHAPESEFVKAARLNGPKFGKIELDNGNDLVESFSVFGLQVHENGDAEYMVMAFSSTQIKHYKRWMTRARGIIVRQPDGRRVTPPLFSHIYRVKTALESNASGSWYGWVITLDAKTAEECRIGPGDGLYEQARAFRDLVASGVAKAKQDTGSAEESHAEDGPSAPEPGAAGEF